MFDTVLFDSNVKETKTDSSYWTPVIYEKDVQ